jgi:hypothetical protein
VRQDPARVNDGFLLLEKGPKSKSPLSHKNINTTTILCYDIHTKALKKRFEQKSFEQKSFSQKSFLQKSFKQKSIEQKSFEQNSFEQKSFEQNSFEQNSFEQIILDQNLFLQNFTGHVSHDMKDSNPAVQICKNLLTRKSAKFSRHAKRLELEMHTFILSSLLRAKLNHRMH